MNKIYKRIIDLTVAIVGLIIGAPIMGVIALLLRIESSGRVIFSQERLGLHGRRFRMHKFRKFPAHWRDGGPGVTVAYDARMGGLGALLERTKLDELPQLWNILKGEMSFVGPRPESTRFADLFSGKYAAILEYTPGIFGPNQVAFRNEADIYPPDEDPDEYYRHTLFSKKMEMDLDYFQRANFFKDIIWVVRGLWVSIIGIIRWRSFLGLHARIVITDILIIETTWVFSHYLRFGSWSFGVGFEYFYWGFLIIPMILILEMFIGGCYRRPVQFFSLFDITRLSIVLLIGWLICSFILLYIERNIAFSLLLAFWFILMPSIALPRILWRINKEKRQNGYNEQRHNIAIYGVGKGSAELASWLNSRFSDIYLIGFLDDSPVLRGRQVNGLVVLGRESDIPTINEVKRIDEIWLTFTPDEFKRKRLEKICEQSNITLVILPENELFTRFTLNPM